MAEKFSVSKRAKSFTYAFKGIRLLLREHNAWIHLLATVLVISAGFYFELNTTNWVAITIAIGIVWVAEGINTAIEYVVDLISPEENELAGKAKDIAAGAVLIASITAVVIGCIVFIPEILSLLA